jgi:hypothetical protein
MEGTNDPGEGAVAGSDADVVPQPLPATGPSKKQRRQQDPLTHTMRSLRRWLIALTSLVALVFIVVAAIFAGFAYEYWQNNSDGTAVTTPTGDQTAAIKTVVSETYADDLDYVNVRRVEVDWTDDTPDMPYSVVYKLRDSPVTIEGLVDDSLDMESGGLTPTLSTLNDQLTAAEFSDLLRAWAQQTDGPMGYVYSYTGDNSTGDYSLGDHLKFGGKDYLADDLWCANEGWVPTQPKTVGDDTPDVRDLVFRLDPKTDRFTYVGTEPSQKPVYGSYDDGGA